MSRCLPFSPIGYSAKIAAGDTLIDSIKLRRETKTDAIAESKKEKKREKKEKKERKLRVKQEVNVFDHSRKRKHEDKTHKLVTDSKLCKGANGSMNDGSELLERSDITEEYGQPCPQIPSTSDTSEDSNRRKRHCPIPPVETGIRAQGNILRIRLAPKKPETPIAVAPLKIKEELQPISTIVRNHVEIRQPKEPSSSGRSTKLTSRDKKLQLADLVYTDLFENWVPSSLSSVEDDGLGWLNEKRESRNEERCKQPKGDVHTSSSFNTTNLWQPQAIFLPEVEVYALPFTVPF